MAGKREKNSQLLPSNALSNIKIIPSGRSGKKIADLDADKSSEMGLLGGAKIIPVQFSSGEVEDGVPPDGGLQAWLVMLGAFFCYGILFGVINSFSVLFPVFHDHFEKRNITNASSKAALVGSLAMGTTFLVSPISGVLTDYIGIRTTTFLGGAIASLGMLLSSFCINNVAALYVTYGMMYGLGGALAYTPSLAVLGHYFKKYLGIVNGIVTMGSSAFTISMPYLIDGFLKAYGIEWTLRFLALIASFIMLFAFLFKPVNKNLKLKKVACSDVINTSVLSNRKYLIWAVTIALSLMGYFIPYVYMVKFVNSNFDASVDGKIPVLCIAITSGLGRLIFGYLGDHPKVDRILLQQLAFLVIGITTMLLPSTAGSLTWLIIVALCLGLFDGCFISLLGPVSFDICGPEGGTQAIGFVLGLCSIPLIIGPYVAGVIYDHEKSYTLPLVLSGIPTTVGSVVLFLTRCVKAPKRVGDSGLKQNSKEYPKDATDLATTEPLDPQQDDHKL